MDSNARFIAYYDDDPKLVLANRPELDRGASRQLAGRLFPDVKLNDTGDGHLHFLNPPKNQMFVGCYGGLRIVAHYELTIDRPSKVDRRWFDPTLGRTAYVHATHSVVDWFAFGLWRDGRLIRSLSVSPDGGVQEQIGDPLTSKRPIGTGSFPLTMTTIESPSPQARRCGLHPRRDQGGDGSHHQPHGRALHQDDRPQEACERCDSQVGAAGGERR